MKYVYVLLCNDSGYIGYNEPFGVCVTSEEEAKKYVEEGGVGYDHSYEKLAIFETKDEAIHWKFEGDGRDEWEKKYDKPIKETTTPNAETIETIRKIESGEGLKSVDSVEEMIEELES